MFNITKNPREYKFGSIVALMVAMFNKGWLSQYPGVVVKGKKAACNIASVLGEILVADKTYVIDQKKYTGAELVEKAKAFETGYTKSTFPVLADGRHRAVAWILGHVLGYKMPGEPVTIECTEKAAQVTALEGNAANSFVTQLAHVERVRETLPLIEDGTYKKEADLPFKRGTSQRVWAACELILAGANFDAACALNKETARSLLKEINTMGANPEIVIEAAGNVVEERNKNKVMSGKDIRLLTTKAKEWNAPKDVLDLLTGIVENANTGAERALGNICGIKKD